MAVMRSPVVVVVTAAVLVGLGGFGLLWSAPAAANDIDLRIDAVLAEGKQGKLTVIINRDVESVAVDVNSGKSKVKQTQGPVSQPGKLEFTLPHPGVGKLSWNGTLTVVFADGANASMPLAFTTERRSTAFKFHVRQKSDIDMVNDKLKLFSERATSRVELEVYTDADELLAADAVDFAPPIAAGQPVEVGWIPRKKGDILRIHLTAFDQDGGSQSSDVFPYTITIPHEDVVFDTGKSVIRADQEPRLQAVVPEVERALQRFGPAMKAANATVKLFVRGHTDSVGDPGSNRALSQARALSIAKWFRQHGIAVAVYARGFGEEDLKVETPDETAEEQNRRADYDVGVDGPTGSLSGWTKVN